MLCYLVHFVRTPNVQPNPDDYEVSIGFSHPNYHVNNAMGEGVRCEVY